MGGFDGYDFTVTFFRDNSKHQENTDQPPTVEREIVSEVVLPVAALKEITRWLLQNVNDIEEKDGVIREPLIRAETKRREGVRAEGTLAAYA